MEPILGLLAIALGVWFWVDAVRAKEAAVARTSRICRELRVQFLDETVRLTRIRPARGESGRLSWRRSYDFEFSADGRDRFAGHIDLLGIRVVTLKLDHPEGAVIVPAGSAGGCRTPPTVSRPD